MENELYATGAHARPDRRHDEDRRVSISASVVEHRKGRDRRHSDDRRGHYQNLFSPDNNFLYEVFVWLIDCTEGEWSSGANDHEPEGSAVTCRVRFDEESDLEAFVAWLSGWQEKHG